MEMAESETRSRRDYHFVNPPPVEFCCCICTELLDDPVEISSCDHLYCRSCITTWLRRKSSCPQCQGTATESSVKEANRYLRSYIDNIHVYCPVEQCSKIMTISELEPHLQSCDKRQKTITKYVCCEQLPDESVEVLKANLSEFQTRVSDLQDEVQERIVELVASEAEKRQLEADKRELEAEKRELQAETRELQAVIRDLEAEKREVEVQLRTSNREIQSLKDAKQIDEKSQSLRSKEQARVLGELLMEKRMYDKSQEEASVLREKLSKMSGDIVRQAQALEVEIRKGFMKVNTAGGATSGSSSVDSSGPESKKRLLSSSLKDIMHDIESAKDSEISSVLQDIRKLKSLCDRRFADIEKSYVTTANHISSKDVQAAKSTQVTKNSVSSGAAAGAKKRSSSLPPSSVVKKTDGSFRFTCSFELDLDMAEGGKLMSPFFKAEGFKWQIIVKKSKASLSLLVRSEPEDKSLEKAWKVGYQLKLLRQGWGQPRTFSQYGELFTSTSNIHGFRSFCKFGKRAQSPATKDVLQVEAIFFRVLMVKQAPSQLTHLPSLSSFSEIEAGFTNRNFRNMQENDETYSPLLVNFNNELKLVMKRTQLCPAFPSQLAVFLHFVNETADRKWINKFDIKLRIRGPKKTASCTLFPPHSVTDGLMVGAPMLEWTKLLDPELGFTYEDGAVLAEVLCNLHQDIPLMKED